jgi:hypothetical protein
VADVTLHDGRDLSVDLHKITIREYRSLFDRAQPQENEDALIARCVGMTLDEYLSLSQPDYRRVGEAFLKRAREPLADPNSVSASSSA